ncbi:patatin-like phospholipase family protein [Sulfurimonas sp. HSL3-7]|uniref:patatin-like phospholipase family protein n=1 Tax=Sulfonitrofixus jiaomeiensis TaxID=3131938 RepID=UPI0031F9DC4F
MKQKTVSLVLGSGGARGMAHIGVIKCLEEHGYKIESVSGCSMGALVGGFYAAGKLDNYTEWLRKIDTLDMLKLLDLKGSGGLVSGETLMEKMRELVGDPLIEELPIKFTAVASDVKEEKEIWINRGSLMHAVRASISIPLFFTPHQHIGRLLIDGGVLNPVPIAPTFDDNTDLTIAVNLGGDIEPNLFPPKKEIDRSVSARIKEYLQNIAIPDTIMQEYGMYEIVSQSIEAMQGTIARMKLAAYPPDMVIEIPRNLCGMMEFNRANEIIEYGYRICGKRLNGGTAGSGVKALVLTDQLPDVV